MMPSSGPRSQCAFGSKSNARGSPQVRTTTLSAALFPTGTLECGMFGSVSSSTVRCRSALSSSNSSCLIFCPRCLLASKRCDDVLALPLGARDLIARGVLLALEAFDLRNQAAAMRFGRGKLSATRRVTFRPRLAIAGLHRFQVVANEIGIQHKSDRVDYSSGVSVRIRKAVFPAAGLGTRFLPATKAQPKEMLPLVDKPTIQYGVEEACNSGVPNIVVVTGRGKNAIEDHFDVSKELEAFSRAAARRTWPTKSARSRT